ncbi:hypothetical protein FQN52_009168 [Onygenales sp. PD_12]|nr:hypothetical protein FQN52_009168 [Onygenales sp. PD_12]KAK2796285.1 hypothetical protein FQN51_009496 [Onygenales sp. PD_10]
MSFGFSVGDFIAVTTLIHKIRKDFVGAPSQFRDISDEVRSLSIVLQDVGILVEGDDPNSQHAEELEHIANGCRDVLETLETTLDKYAELQSVPEKAVNGNIGRRMKRAWKKLKWEPDDIRDLRSRIVLNLTLLKSFEGKLTSQIFQSIKVGVDRLNERQDDREHREERQAILNWITTIDYASQQNDYINRRQSGTGEWLLTSPQFQEWVGTKRQTLFCPGIPGAGKTILSSVVIDHLHTRFLGSMNVGVAYVYCNFRRKSDQKAEDLLASLLKQLAQGLPSVPDSLKILYAKHRNGRTRPSFKDISETLQSLVMAHSRVFVLVDALDECQMSDGHRMAFLAELFSCYSKCEMNIFATSRFVPEIVRQFKSGLSIEIRASNDDVSAYLEGRMGQLPSFVQRNQPLQEEIKKCITEAVDGMFLLAQLYFDSLEDKTNPKAVRGALKSFQKQNADLAKDGRSFVLDNAYEQAMERINGQKQGFRELAMSTLQWITHARRPLSAKELQHALAVEIGEVELDEENISEIEDILSACGGLVTVDEETSIIRLVHYTTQEYFEQTQSHWFPDAETNITKACMAYLSFKAFGPILRQTKWDVDQRLPIHPFYGYAIRQWGDHAARAPSIYQEVADFLDSRHRMDTMSEAHLEDSLVLCPPEAIYYELPFVIGGLHLAAYFGLSEVIKVLCTRGYDVNLPAIGGRTPLSLAAENGWEAAVEVLLATRGIDPNLKDRMGQTPVEFAARSGRDRVVKQLLAKDGIDPNGVTALSMAIYFRHHNVVETLLATEGVYLDLLGALKSAVISGQRSMEKLLLATERIDLTLANAYSDNLVVLAIERGRNDLAELLIDMYRADAHARDDDWVPIALVLAVVCGSETVVEKLLAKGNVDCNIVDEYGQTPLSVAAGRGHAAIVKLLLKQNNIDPNMKDKEGLTPLWWAKRNGHHAVVELLESYTSTGVESTEIAV